VECPPKSPKVLGIRPRNQKLSDPPLYGIRVRYRYVILHRLNIIKTVDRYNIFDDNAKNDNDRLIKNKKEESADLKIAHIIPHSLAFPNNTLMPLIRLPLPGTFFNKNIKLNILSERC
jgi:hypothetical protein